jgi:hypothetical protein
MYRDDVIVVRRGYRAKDHFGKTKIHRKESYEELY